MSQAQTATKTATDNIQKGLGKVESALKSVAKVAATYISVKAIVNFGKSCVELGSNLSEIQNVVDTTFGSMSSSIDDFAKNAIQQFGLSETAAKKYSSTMGAMLKSMGMNQNQVLSMSTTLAGLAGDMASFYNISTDEAFAKIRSGISGETEPLKQLGINLSVANLQAFALSQGITKSYNSMTQAEQALLRYNYLLKSTADAQGDFSKTSGSWANQVRILTENFNSLKATIGQGLIMALTPVIQFINKLIERLQELAEGFKYFMSIITGVDISTETVQSSAALADDLSDVSAMAVSTSDSVESISDSLKDANKEAKKFLFSFDEIHALQSDDSNKDSDSSLTGSGTIGLDTNIEPIDELVTDNALNGLDEANKKLNNLSDSFGLADETKKRIEEAAQNVKNVIEAIKDPVEDAADVVADEVGGAVEAVKGIAEVVNGIHNDDMTQKATGAMDIMSGKDKMATGLGTAWAWIKEHVFQVENATEDYRASRDAKSPLQKEYDFAKWYADLAGVEMNGVQSIWRYITPERYENMRNNGGMLTVDDLEDIFTERFNPWGDWNYAMYYAKSIGDTDFGMSTDEIVEIMAEFRDMWSELEEIEHQGEVYGDVTPPGGSNDQTPATPPMTKEEFQEAMIAAIDGSAQTEIGIYVDGEDLGRIVLKSLLTANTRVNPEVATVP